MLFLVICFFSKSTFFVENSGIPSECQTDWIQIRPDILSRQILVQSLCKGYEQMTLHVVGNGLNFRINEVLVVILSASKQGSAKSHQSS